MVLEGVRLRQWVLTVPHELRARLAYDGEALGGEAKVCAEVVQGFYRRALRDLDFRGGKSSAVTVVQRTSSDLRLNPHFHLVALDGVYALEERTQVFHQLPRPLHENSFLGRQFDGGIPTIHVNRGSCFLAPVDLLFDDPKIRALLRDFNVIGALDRLPNKPLSRRAQLSPCPCRPW